LLGVEPDIARLLRGHTERLSADAAYPAAAPRLILIDRIVPRRKFPTTAVVEILEFNRTVILLKS